MYISACRVRSHRFRLAYTMLFLMFFCYILLDALRTFVRDDDEE